jgi:natural product biosynthesis luciferase-like monooxygenase protein/amino acid adenylation domain-containing protein
MHTVFDETNPERLTLVDILRWRAQHEPQRVAYTFLLDGETKQVQMTYADLDHQARRIAALLQERFVPGERVLLLYPPGLEYITAIFGCFYAGAVAVPAYPPRLNRSLMRIQTILQDARATVALTTSTILSSLHRRFTDETLMQDLLWIATDTMIVGGEQEPRSAVRSVPALRELSPDPEALALLQYTSGSTGSPKGVMLTHTNLMQNAALIQEGMSLTPDTRSVFWLPPYHDMGLMGGILQALYTGYPTVVMAPTAFVQQPLRWLQAISSFRATMSGGPNFAYDLCVKKATPDTIRALDLSSWAVAFNGAEPVRAETLARFAETFALCGFLPEMFYPCYGMAETTLFVSGGQASEMPGIRAFDMQALETGHAVEATGGQELGRPLVSCGYIRQGQDIAIVDPQTCNRLPPGTIGEIWVRSPNVALGYWGKAQETMETFQAFLQDNLEGPFLRTGDLGFCLEEELYVTGRLKDVIIIRGRNLYPQDIEQVVEKSHPLLRQGCCAVFGVESGQARRDSALRLPGDKPQPLQVPTSEQLVVVQEVGRHYDDVGVHEAIQTIRQAVLSEFDVEVAAIELLRAGTIFKTSSGKIQRSACRESFLKGELNAVYRWKRAEEPHPLFVWQKKRDEAEAEQAQSTVPTVSGFGRQALTPKVQEIVEWLVRHIAQRAQIDPRIVDLHAPFVQFGLNSLEAVDLSGELEQWLGRSLSPTLIYDYPSIDALACHLAGADLAVGRDRHADGTHPATRMDAIAIIGLGCRFPGANNPEAFWRMLYDGVDGISLVPATRWNVAQFYAPDQATPRKMNTRWGGFLQDIEQFDPAFFRLSPREAEVMDPQQRLLLEVAWEAFEHAGLVPERLAGRECGVFIGMSSSDYYTLHSRDLDYHQAYTGTGNAHSIAANRLSYFFDFHGPSVAIDTACSSSLFAIHQACQSLRNGECDLALAGGVNVILAPELGVSLSQAHMLSADGRCKTFDADASGYVRSEGCGIVLLKPLADAQRDGDTVLAIIRGSAVNQDGRSNGLTAPNGPSQEAVIRRALQHARVSPHEMSYVETHGSSTSLGDPIEVAALRAVLMPERSPDQSCLLGAVKTNIGHLEAAAGIAGLIKTVLCLQKGVIAPNLHFKRLNPHISLAGTTFEIPTEPRPWPGSPDTPRFAGVSAFGFGGTNVHVILEGVPQDEAVGSVQGSAITKPVLEETGTTVGAVPCACPKFLSERPVHLLTLSGRTAQALAVLTQRYQDFLADHPTVSLADLCFTAQTGRTHFTHRLAVYAEDQQQMCERLAARVSGQPPKEMQVGAVRPGGQGGSGLAFLFTGQGSQYINMGRQLYETQPAFRQVLDECDHLLRSHLPQDQSEAPSLLSLLYPADGAQSPINETAYAQPALFALSYALAQMWLSWGVKPDVVMGHSVGEYVAACVAGLFSLEDGLKLIAARGRLMQSLPEPGTMAVIFAAPEQVQSFLAPYAGQVAIAAINGSGNTVISGREETVQLIVQHLAAEGVRAHLLAVSHAFHSPLMDPMLDAFEQVAREVPFAPLRLPLVCNLTGQLVNAGESLDAHYWRRQTREAVQFAAGIQTLSAHGYELFLELGPTPVLSNMGKRCLPANSATWLSSLHQDHDDWPVLMQSIACLYAKGYDLNWSGFYGDSIHHKIALPTYPFEREYCWFKSAETNEGDTGGDRVSWTNKADVKDFSIALDNPKEKPPIDFGLIFFSSNEATADGDDYRLVIESAKYADQHDFSSVWIPERHFTKEGWLYPSPAILISALARETSHIHLRAGSVVAPLHHPLRIAEEWARVDKLSGGRVEVSFASGWHPNDFALAPETYADRHAVMYRTIEIVRKLWRGETVPFQGGDGKLVELKTYPSPMQHDIPIWLTAAGNPQTFANAGKLGAHLLTHLYNQSIDELAEKIRIYRDARAEHGYDPDGGKVSVMLHTYIGADRDTVQAQIQGPFSEYLKSASYLVHAIGHSRGQQVDLSRLSEQDREDYLVFVMDRLIREQRVLFGTPETCAPLVTQLQAAGVDEIACQMDFGVESDLVLGSLPYLNKLRGLSNGSVGTDREQAPSLQAPVRETVPYTDRTGRNMPATGFRTGASPVPTTRQNEIKQWLYQLRWEAVDLPRSMAWASPGHWLVFLDQKGIGQHLSSQLREQGHTCTLIEAGRNFQLLDPHHYRINPSNPQEIKQAVGTALAAVQTLPLRGVVHLWSLDTTPVEALNLTTLEADQILGVQSALSLIQALIEQSVQTQIWLITQGAQPVEEGDRARSAQGAHPDLSILPDPYRDLAISQAPLWGLGKTCAMEHPALWGGLVDLDPHAIVSDATNQLMRVLQGNWREDQIALRGTKTYVARMVRRGEGLAPALQEPRALHLTSDAAYLITGGLWGLGLECARWLAMQGARHLILLGRSKLPPRETWEQVQPESRMDRQIAGIRAIERLGAQVHYASVDVADSVQLTKFLEHYQQQEKPPVRGILHAASVWQDAQGQSLMRPLVNLKAEDLATVLRPKMLGGWLLSNLLKETPLDFFVSFSSAASLLGSVGQSNYAAANEFLDVLAHYQRAHGQPAVSIDWGPVSEIGMGTTPEMLRVHEYWESHGLERLSPQQVLAALELLIQEDLARVGVLRLDWQLLRQFYPQMADLSLVSQLVSSRKETGDAAHEGTHDESDVHNGTNILQTLRDAYEEEHSAILTSYVKAQIATVLRVSAQRLEIEEPLTSLGFDSLMAIELKNRMDLDLQIRLPIMTLLQGPSITQLVQQVLVLAPSWIEAVETRTGTRIGAVGIVPNACEASPQATADPAPTESLSHNQKALWFLSRLEPESAAYNLLYVARIQQQLDLPALQRALLVLAARYPILTATYTLQNNEPVQQTHANQTLPLEVKVPISGIDANSRSLDDLKLLLLEESNRPIDLTKGPVLRLQLYQLASDDYLLGFILHHIVADFWALDLLVDELSLLYAVEKTEMTELEGQTPDRHKVRGQAPNLHLRESDVQNADYVRWQQSMLQSEEGKQHWQYWQDVLAGDLPVLSLPTDRPRPPLQTYKGASQGFSFSTDLAKRLRSIANEEKVTLFTLMLTAYQVLLHRYSNQDDILVGTPALGRTRSEFEHVIGSLTNPVVVRARLGQNPTFKDLLQQTKRDLLAALEHQDFPFPLLVERLQLQRDPSYSPIYQTLLIWDRPRTRNGEARAGHSQALSLEPFAYGQQGAPFDLTLTVFEIDDRLSADFRYNVDLFDASTIARMAEHFLTLLDGITNNLDQHIRELPLLPDNVRQTLLTEWNATHCDYPQDLCVHQLFEQQVELTPDAIAAVFEDTSLTYRELNSQANHLAHRLLREGVGPEVLIGVCMERSLELVIALLAVLKAGGAYVPLDPLLPQERFTFLLEDAQVPVILTQNHRRQSSIGYGDQLPPTTVKTICLASGISPSLPEHTDNPKLRVLPENQAYMIYTSGSTGKPKGTMNTHRGICNRLLWMQDTYQLTPSDRVLQKTPFSFDVSVWEFFWPLLTGASLIMARPGGHQDSTYLRTLIVQQQVTTLHFVPSMLQAFLWNESTDSKTNLENCTSLRQVICSGEALTASLQARLFAHVTEEVKLHNLYGPTEAAIDVTFWECQHDRRDSPLRLSEGGSVPIGRPIANTQIYLLDADLQPVPIGIPGELYIGGVGLARGYFKRPDLTAEKFIANPFGEIGGERLYRTGDLARYRADGAIEFLGRIDQQVKLRGFRIELGEIEAVLQTHPAVQEAVVVLREEETVGQYLAAYVVTQRTEPHLQEELQSHLRRQLPDYMVPAIFVPLETVPLTPNGKLNHKALPVPERTARRYQGYVAPQSELEQRLSGIWQEVLRLAQVGIYDNFFDLGGHSLLLIQVQSKLEGSLGYEVPVVDLFHYPTIHALSTHLGERQEQQPLLQPIAERVRRRKEERVTNAEGIAIVGVAGRFPGARNIEEFWQNLCHGVESISFFSEEELLASGVEPDLIHDPRYVKAHGILDDVEYFDAAFFGYSPKEAALMDPQQRLFLECAWEVLEQAGILIDDSLPDTYQGLIGVYAGQSASTYLLSNLLANPTFLTEAGTFSILVNNDKDFLATRTSYKLNLKGPGITIQTACSTSLVAVHMACQGLLRYECDMALAGGASIIVPQKAGYLYEEEGILSPDGHCRAFDAEARGTVSGNGVGIVALKRLSDAMTSGDTIYAVIRGSAINNDGAAKVGYTAPSVEGQVKVIAEAIAMAGVEPESISYVETHGTGTALGDPIEIAALTQAFRASGQAPGKGASPLPTPTPTCAIGSLKTNLGHLDAAAGVAGLIKTVLALKYGMIPPSLHFHHPNPKIDFAGSPFYVNTHLTAWEPGNVPRRAGVSSFGIGGTNAHVILEEPPPISLRRDSALSLSGSHEKPHLIVLSAKTASALETMTEQLATYVKSHPDVHLADMAYTLQMGRKSFPHRRAFVARSRTDMLHLLTTLDPESVFTGLVSPETKQVAFLFPGQGPQYVNMGRELYEQEPTFRQQVDTCAEWLVPHLHCDLREIIYPPVGQEAIAQDQLDRMSLAQPAIFVIEYALAQFWMQRGLRPAAMIGHSIGEYVAACLAGVLSLEDALLLVALRGRLMDQLPSGGMLAVSLSEEKLRPKLSARLSFAAHNSTTDCVVSGPTDAIESLEQSLREQGITCRLLRVSRASHSQMVEPVLEQFTNAVKKCHLHSPRLSYVSNVTGKWITEQEATDTGYWARHWRQTVRFAEGMRLLLDSPNMVLLEVGPGHSLSTLAQRTGASPVPTDRTILSSLRHPQTPVSDRAFLLNTCGRLWCAGVVIDWSQFYVGEQQRRIPLPTYPFEWQRYWISPVEAGQRQGTAPTASGDRPEENALWQLHKEPDLARWFSVPSWKRSPLAAVQVLPLRGGRVPDQEPGPLPTPTAPACKSCWLIFTDSIGLGTHLRKHLVEKELVPFQETVITVRVGTQFHSHRDCPNGWEYTIRPDSREDYDTLLNDISSCGMFPAHIVHMWTVIATDHIQSGLDYFETAQALGFYSLLFLTQALSEQKGEQPQEIAIITNNLQEVMGGEVLCPARATALGVGKVAPHEYPHITYRSIDIVLPMTIGQGQADRDKPLSLRVPMTPMELAWDQLVDQIIAELRWRSSDVMVAYRGPHRWVQCIEPMQLPPVAEEKLPFKQQGVYLITGGLGGIGLTMAEYLASQVRARLVLTGRTALPAREEWGHRLAILSEQDAVASKIHQIKRLEELGAEVLVIEADVTDLEQMQAVIRQVGEHFGDLHGVIHTAGTPGGGLIQLKTSEVAAGVLAPKVKGTLVLEAVLKDMQPDFLILCSSLSALIGEPGQVDYCAANTFLDSFAFYHTVQKRVKTISIDWDTWQEVGMAVNALKPYKKALKYNTEIQQRLRNGILPQEGVEVFRRILINRDISQVIVSTDGILARLEQVKSLLEEGDVGSRAGESPAVRSRQGKVPVDKPGDRSDDLVSPSLDQRPNLQTPYVPPQNETQQQIAAIWQKLLGIEKIGIHDNFVDLGGHSLLGTQLITRLRDTFQIDVSLRTLFEEPTVARLALVIVQKKAELVDDTLLLQAIEDLENLTDDEVQTLLAVDAKQTGKVQKI